MNLFDQRMKPVKLIKTDGTSRDIKADIQSNKIYVRDINAPIEIGDIIERYRSNGIIDQYKVVDVTICDHPGSTLNHIEIDYQNLKAQSSMTGNITINGNISAQKVNIQATDNSVTCATDAENLQKFQELKCVLEQQVNIDTQILSLVSEMSNSIGTPSFKENYKTFIGLIADHMTVVNPFLPWLLSLL